MSSADTPASPVSESSSPSVPSASEPPASTSPPAPIPLSAERRERLERCVTIVDGDSRAFAADTQADEGWVSESDAAPGVAVASKAMPASALRKYRACGILHAPPDAIAHLLWNPPARMAWDHSYLGVERLGTVIGDSESDEVVLQRMMVRAVLIVAQRDFVCCHMKRRRADGSYCTVSYAAPPEDGLLEPVPEFVRASVLEGSGWTIRPVSGPAGEAHAELCYTIYIDIAGWVPYFIVNAAISHTFATYYCGLAAAIVDGR